MPKGAKMKVFICGCGKIVRATHLKPEEDGFYRVQKHLTPRFNWCKFPTRVIPVVHKLLMEKRD